MLGLSAAAEASDLVERIMAEQPEWFVPVLERAEDYEIQVLYTQIDRDADNRPVFRAHPFRLDAQRYFYPASVVKLAGAVLALEKLNRLAVAGLDKNSVVEIDSAFAGQTTVSRAEGASIVRYIDKLFAVSDNDAYNRLYEFLGQQYLNGTLWAKGYGDVRLTHRLSVVLSPEENRHTNPFSFFRDGNLVYQQPLVGHDTAYRAAAPILRGRGYIAGGELVEEPKDFAGSNYMSVEVCQELLKAVLFPEAVEPQRRFDLSADDYAGLYQAMGRLPRENRQPQYDPEHYWDSYVKFFLFGDSKEPIPSHIRLFNKVGLAYGYMIDNAYIVDFERGVEFLLTAVISVNANGIYNDGVYEYDEVGFPFLARLGRAIYQYELQRDRPRRPDLSRFEVNFAD